MDRSIPWETQTAPASEADGFRQHARLLTRAQARLWLPGQAARRCEIRDFSQRGLQIMLLDTSEGPLPGGRIEIEFPLDAQDKAPHRLAGNLIHAAAGSYGVKLDQMPTAAYQSLVAQRAHLASPPGESGLLVEESQAIQRDCLHLFHWFLDRIWQAFLARLRSKLEDRDTGMLPLTEQSRFLSAIGSIILEGEAIGRELYAHLVDQMQRLGESLEAAEPLSAPLDELSLIDDGSFDEWLSLANIYNRIENDNDAAIYQFTQRFSRVTPVNIDRHNDPFGPKAVCLAFQDSLKAQDLSQPMRGQIYKLYGEILAAHYPDFYERLIQLLSPLKPARLPSPNRVAAEPSVRAEAATADHAGHSPESLSQQIHKLSEIAEKLFSLSPGQRATAAEAPAPVDRSPDAGPAATPWVEPESLQILRSALAQGDPSGQAEAASPGTAYQALIDQAPAANTVTERLLALLDQGERLPLSTRQRNALGVAGQFMHQALADQGEHSDLEVLLQKFERPLYERVLKGEDPLTRPDHPLARVINLVDRFAIVTDDLGRFSDREMADLLTTIVERAVAAEGQDLAPLEQAASAMEKLLKHPSLAHRQRIATQQDLFEAQSGVLRVRLAVAQQLDALFSERALPRLILDLLDQGLRQHLVRHTLRAQDDEVRATLHLLDTLVGDAPLPALDPLMAELDRRLAGNSLDPVGLERLRSELRDFLEAPGQATRHRLPAGWFVKESGLEDTAATRIAPDMRPPRLGEWWDFSGEGRPVAMQLVWIGEQPAGYGFINRPATRTLRLTPAEFAKQIHSGTLKRGENRGLPLLERSQNSTVDNLYRQLAWRAHHDPGTELLNRNGFLHALERRPRTSAGETYLCLLDIEPYRALIDSRGPAAGTALLREVGARLNPRFGQEAGVAVLGDGRLGLLLTGASNQPPIQAATALVEALRGKPFEYEGQIYSLDAHAGLTSLSEGPEACEDMLSRAAMAVVAARKGGEIAHAYETDSPAMRKQEALNFWGRKIDTLLAGQGLFLRGQAITPLQPGAGRSTYYEVLLGLRDDGGSVISPQSFVEAVEHWKRHLDLDRWVVEQTFDWIRRHPAAFHALGGFSINLSGQSLVDPDMLATLHRLLAPRDIEAGRLSFEITETATMENFEAAGEFIRQIRDYGCGFCIDDFGSGNASYGYLRHLRTDTLKIDGTYVKDMLHDANLRAMVKSMNDIGHSLGMKTVAEYIATPELLALARELGIDYAQGYAVGKPVPLDELAGR
ncbi:MAG: DUF1631 family protein [Pseudomonadota bacterium]